MRSQQIARDDRRLRNPQGERLRLHAVLNRENALLEQLPLRAMRFLRGVVRNGVRLLGKSEIRIARQVGRLHCRVAGQRRRNAEFLLASSRCRRRRVPAAA